MISAGLVVDRQAHGLGLPPHHHHHHPNAHMTFDSPFLLSPAPPGPPSKPCSPPEFLRPLPKPAPIVQRYNGVSTTSHGGPSLNGCRTVTTPRVTTNASKYSQHDHAAPVNLVKEADSEEPSYSSPSSYRFPAQPYYPTPYGALYSSHYNSLMSRGFLPPPRPPPHNPIDTFRHQSPPAPSSPGQFLSPPTPTFSPPQPPSTTAAATPSATSKAGAVPSPSKRPFKVPSGKEGSLKHRILTRPAETSSPKKRVITPPNFTKGSLIQLSNGELKKVEDMRTEDFVKSAEKSEALRLDPSTVVRIEEGAQGTVLLTLSYGENRSQEVDFESSLEHPFFVFGQGWSSYSPERSFQMYGLRCNRLQVGDICISLTPRTPPPSNNNSSSSGSASTAGDDLASLPRKRRWSAPEHSPDDEPPKKT